MPGNVITDILAAPFQGIIDGVSQLIKDFVKDPEANLNAQVTLAKLTADTNVAIMSADQAFADAQAQVIEAEAKEGWLAANWRPCLMFLFIIIIANNYLFAPWFSVKSLDIPPDLWALLKLGVTGYIVGRSAEKFLPDTAASVASAVQAAKKP